MFEVAAIADLRSEVLALPCADTDAGLVDQITALERLTSAAAAMQARLTEALDDRRTAAAESRRLLQGAPRRRRPNPDAGLGLEIGLARRTSPHEGRRKLHLARTLVRDLPETLAALEAGDLNEHRAEVIARPLRRVVDRSLRAEHGTFEGLSDDALRDEVRREVLRRDEQGDVARRAKAGAQRRVTGRILGDSMGRLTAILPSDELAQVMGQLSHAADRRRTAGDERTKAQLMVDVLVSRLGGRPLAGLPGDTHSAPNAPIALKLVVPAETLLDDESTEPGYVPGVGFIGARAARQLIANAGTRAGSTLQRLFAMPQTGALIALESTSSLFRSGLAEFLTLRDRRCRTPWCNAPIRHLDHIRSRAGGGETSAINGEGLCEACNYAKETEGWRHDPPEIEFRPHTVELTTPTGHRHASRSPRSPGNHRRRSRAEQDVHLAWVALAR
jgi:hypothetical protein